VEPDARREALAVATRALARREHSRRSLRDRLARAGVSAEDAEAVIHELCETGLVDDGRFAQERARVLAERGKGDTAIRFDLERAGVDSAEIEQALASVEPERERVAALVARRGATPEVGRLLAGRGFDEELVAGLIAREQ
jgi:regulatory protein